MRFTKSQIERIAREFWSTTDEKYRVNFDIAGAVEHLPAIDVIHIDRLSPGKVEDWLKDMSIEIQFGVNDRNLHGILFIRNEHACMFLDKADSETQQRFTIAHEMSHYLLDYQLPKERAMLELGTGIKEVLNGNVKATEYQLVLSLIKGVDIEPYTVLIEKKGQGSFSSWTNYNAENEADYLALELLAPRARVISDTISSTKRLTYSQFNRKSLELLTCKYGIPSDIAKQYASQLAYAVTKGPSFLDKLGL